MTIYLDYNSSTPVHSQVLNKMVEVYKLYFGNADSRTHIYGQQAREIVEDARSRIAELLLVRTNEIIFTSGATESNNLAILGLAKWGEQNNRRHIISTKIEHKAVLEPLKYLSKNKFEIDFISVDKTGRIDSIKLLEKIRPDTLLVSVMHANNETGIIQPVKEIGEALSNTNVYFHIDAAQTFGKLVEELKMIKYDMLSISGHKVYGPQGIGALILRKKNYMRPPVQPITFGGEQESGLRPGTLPIALISGMGEAAKIAGQEFEQWNKKNLKIKQSILKQLTKIDYVINGDQDYCLSNTLNISFPGVDSEALMLAAKKFYALSNGSACTSHDYASSHVLLAMDLDNKIIESALRLSWGPLTNNLNLTLMLKLINNF